MSLNDTAKLCVGQLDVRLPRALHKEGGKARSKYSRTHAVNPVSMQRVEYTERKAKNFSKTARWRAFLNWTRTSSTHPRSSPSLRRPWWPR